MEELENRVLLNMLIYSIREDEARIRQELKQGYLSFKQENTLYASVIN